MTYDINKTILMPIRLNGGLAWVVGTITAWQDFYEEDGVNTYRVYECKSNDGKNKVAVSETLIKEYRWK